MSKIYDLVRCTVLSAPGTGSIAIGPAINGFLTFTQGGVQNGDLITYAINDGLNSEIGHGTFTTATNTLSRDVVFSSTNGGIGGSKINASATAQVFITIAAEDTGTLTNILVGTTQVTGATNTNLLYNNAGILGNLPQTNFFIVGGNNTLTGTNVFNGSTTFNGAVSLTNVGNNLGAPASITLPANTVGTTQIIANSVQNSDLAQMPATTIKGNNTGGTANAADLTVAQVQSMLGFVGSLGTVKTTNYTIQTTDQGATLLLAGGAFFTVTFQALVTYPTNNFAVRLINQDTAAGKAIVIPGFSTVMLYPGQIMTVFAGSGTFAYSTPGRWLKTGATFFVDVVNGSDSNDGLSTGAGRAFQTMGKAFTVLYDNVDCQNATPTINVAAGTYVESITVQGQLTGVNVGFLNATGSVTWKPANGVFCFQVTDGAEWELTGAGFTFDGAGNVSGIPVALHQTAILDVVAPTAFQNWGGGNATLFQLDHGGGNLNLSGNITISSSIFAIVTCGPQCAVTCGPIAITIGGSLSCTSVIVATNGSIALNSGMTFPGSVFTAGTKFNSSFTGAISLAGLSLPAPSAGVTSSGGVAA